MPRPTIYKPIPKWNHPNQGFRELIDLWEQAGLVTVAASPDRFCWWGKPGEVLLYDFPVTSDHGIPEHNLGLFGNKVPNIPTSRPWIFWPRYPDKMRKFLLGNETIPIRFRFWKSLFVGKIQNQIQANNRFAAKIDWSKHIQFFHVVKGVDTPHPFDPESYMKEMSKTRIALLLPGYGPKCQRDIEAMALGCVPLVTPGVCTNYHDPWIENVHYLEMKTENDLKKLMNKTSKQLQAMSNENISWYERNCSVRGSFKTTEKVIANG